MKKTLIIPLSYCLCIICLSIPACVTVEKAEVNVDEKKLIIELTKPENMEKIAHALKLVGEKTQLAGRGASMDTKVHTILLRHLPSFYRAPRYYFGDF